MILETRIGAKIKEPNLRKGIHSKSDKDAMDVDAFGKSRCEEFRQRKRNR